MPRPLPTDCNGMDGELIRRAEEYVRALFAANAGGHDVDHTMRVYSTAMRMAETEPSCDKTVTALAALLHDADDHKLFHTQDNANARRFMAENGVPPETAERVIRAVNAVSFSRNGGARPDTPEGCVVQDADRLDAIGAVGVARTFVFGGEHGRPMGESVQHFYDKLLRLKGLMNTPSAQALAEERHAFMEAFLAQYYKETGEEKP